MSKAPKLEFSEKYDEKHAKQYFDKHQDGFWRKLSDWRDQQIAKKALKIAGNPKNVLDVPCGTGRFWQTLIDSGVQNLHICDYSQNMIDTGMHFRPAAITSQIKSAVQGSAFDIPVADQFVDSIFCIRFVHHVAESKDRIKLLKEFHRVSKDTAIISLWVDGNYKSWLRKKLESKRDSRSYQNRIIIPQSVIEAEFKACGFEIVAKLDFLKFYHMWRTYVIKKI